ncbi:hypothetical protein Dsin_025835 [Dipteronia sinensis]|uniref:Reverse transcriptase n=1 Tax=Dipteronia sinensis TaxID=43782 RepID=A0AAD9ZWF0_9ROSI|nr:hypothetical protein Dsin_025835 [Dipteronia sinensis]
MVLEVVDTKLIDQMVQFLEMNFSVADVRKAVFDMSSMKAPGKDGLPAIFYQKYWGKIGLSVTNCCLDVFNNDSRCVLDGVILEAQSTFIPGRLNSDNTVVGFECLDRLKRRRRKHGSMTIKLDMSKSYDRVEWNFVE